jgi:hypothetical protein
MQVAFLGDATECVVRLGDVETLVRTSAGHYASEAVHIFFSPEKALAIALDQV